MPHGFDNTWGIVKDSGLVLSAFLPFLYLFDMYLTSSVSLLFRLASIHK